MADTHPNEKSFGCAGCLFKSGLGCFSFLAGSALVMGALAPAMLGSYIRDDLAEGWSAEHEGSLDIGSLELAWTRPQHLTDLRIFDPAEVQVLRGSAVLPSILDLAFTWDVAQEIHIADVEAEVVVDAEGRSNLARALERTDARSKSSYDLGVGERPFQIDIRIDRLSWRDERQGSGAPETRIEGLEVQAALPGDGGARISGEGSIVSELTGGLSFEASFPDRGWWDAPSGAFEGELHAERVPSAWIDSALDGEGLYRELFGRHADLHLIAHQDEEGGVVDSLLIESDRTRVRCDATFRASRPFDLDAWARGAAVQFASGTAEVTGLPWEYLEGRLPLAIELALADPGSDEILVRVEDYSGAQDWRVGFTMPELFLRGSERLTETALVLERRPGRAMSFGFSATHDHADGGFIEVSLSREGDDGRGTLTVQAEDAATAWLEAASAEAGWMPAALGDRVDVDLFVTDFDSRLGRVAGQLRSPRAVVDLSSNWVPGLLRGAEDDGLRIELGPDAEAAAPLTQLILPFLSYVRSVEGGSAAQLSVTGFEIPLDGDLRHLNGAIEVRFGEGVHYGLAPFLEAVLAPAIGDLGDTSPLPTIRMRAASGVLVYEPFAISVDEFDLVLSGSFDLAQQTLQLRTEVPMSLLDTTHNRFLEQYGQLIQRIQEDVAIPVLLEGPVSAPAMSVDADFRAEFLDAAMGSIGKVVDLIGDQVDQSVLSPLEALFGGDE